ncbi:helix-turn-helix domain-containing protein, partial [Klebsiella pneumoniae]|uniref:helix-turn-helix domain-containing protein n=1 Tax=Klebsiella pneumoniae TaxID=573 RepID=UPI0022324858
EWVHVQLHQQKGMISLSPPTICNSALNPAQRQAALEHMKSGASISAIAHEFGTSRQTIMRLRDDAVSPELPE